MEFIPLGDGTCEKIYYYTRSRPTKGYRIQEVMVLRRLQDCPYVPKYHSHTFNEQRELIIRMEYCNKGTLLRNRNPEDVGKMCHQVATAMLRLQELEIYHEDLCGRNIFVTEDGTYKLGDFGLLSGKKIESDFEIPSWYFREDDHYWEALACGPYFHPDLDNCSRESQGVWALGCTAFWMLTGEEFNITKTLETGELIKGMLNRNPEEQFTIKDVVNFSRSEDFSKD